MIGTSDIKKMSLAEHLQAMELLWESISGSPDKITSPEWHGDVLAARKAKVDAGKATFLTVQQVKKRLARNRS